MINNIQNLTIHNLIINFYGENQEEISEQLLTNFKITGDFANHGIIDETSFISYLETQSYLTNVVVSSFNITGNILECNLQATGFNLALGTLGLTAFEGNLEGISGLEIIDLSGNNITVLSENLILPQTVSHISLVNNTNFNEQSYIDSELFANNLHIAPIQNAELNFNLTGFTPQLTNFGQIVTAKGWTLTDITR